MGIQDDMVGLYLGYAIRAVLGGGKGKYVMMQLEIDNPELHKAVMAEAERQVKEMGIETEEQRRDAIVGVMGGGLRTMAKIVDGVSEKDK